MKKMKKTSGFSLMEVLASLFVIMVLVVGVYSLLILYFQISNENKMYVIAIELANQKMEQIRNMPYDDVGVIGGLPPGIIEATSTVYREGTYTIYNYVTFYDDPADGLISAPVDPDTIPNDYKIATIEVTWYSKSGIKKVTVFSKIIPRTVETNMGYGLLKITVRDSYAQPVPSARIHVVNTFVPPPFGPIDTYNITNSQGLLYLPATSSDESYEITVDKIDQEPAIYWGMDYTYGTATGKTPRHLSVSKGNMTEEEFQIDPLATLHLNTVSTNLPDNFKVNQTKTGRGESSPQLAVDNGNNIYYVWEGVNSTSSIVYAGKFNSAGVRNWGDNTISASIGQSNPDIVSSAAGDLYIVWQDSSVELKKIVMAPGATRYAKTDKIKESVKTVLKKSKKISFQIRGTIKNKLLAIKNKVKSIFSMIQTKIKIARGKIEKWPKNISKQTADTLHVKEASAAATIVQAVKVSTNGYDSENTMTLTFNSTPTAGNVIVIAAVHSNYNDSFTAPAGFTQAVYSDIGGFSEGSNRSLDVGIWYKVAGGSEGTSFSIGVDNGTDDVDGGVMVMMEISGLDTTDLIDVVRANSQIGVPGNKASTTQTAISTNNGFAIAAMAFADNDLTNPVWSSASAGTWTQQVFKQWSEGYDGTFGVATMAVNTADEQEAGLTLSGAGEERNSVIVVFNLIDPDDARVESGGTQATSILRNTANNNIGGHFAITGLTGSVNVTSIRVAENGTIDAQTDLDNIKLVYDLDTSAPYDCASESYGGSEAQFGATDTDGFSGANGTVQMNGSVNISTTRTMCVYVVMDIGIGAVKDETIELEITNPSSDVTINVGTVIPATAAVLSGTTEIDIPAEFQQTDYRWRNDDGDEDGASWLTDINTAAIIKSGEKARLRLRIANIGSISASAAYRLEFAQKVTTCAAVGGGSWNALPNNDSLHWRTVSSVEFTDGEATTQQIGTGAYSAGEIKMDANQTTSLPLAGDTATELEFTIAPTDKATDATYCFRLSNAGTALDSYSNYGEINVVGDENIYIIKLDSGGNTVWTTKRVNRDVNLADQTSPSIAFTERSGTATTVVVWLDNRSGNNDIYAQAFNSSGAAQWNGGNDLQITNTAANEAESVVVIDSNDDIIIAWTERGTPDTINMMKYDQNGNIVWGPTPGPIAGFGISEPSLAVDSSGNFYLGYTEDAIGNQNAYAAKYSSAGVKDWDRKLNVDADIGNRYSTAISVNGTELFGVWTDKRSVKESIYAQKFNLTTGIPDWSRDVLANISSSSGSSTEPAIAITPAGDAFATWTDGREVLTSVYSTKLIAPSAINPVANVPLHIWGMNTISETPVVYENDFTPTTNGSGVVDIKVEADSGGYQIETGVGATVVIQLIQPNTPLSVLPAQDQTINIFVE